MKTTKDQVQDTRNQSQKIRDMARDGQTNGDIAKALGIRYQTVWRTLHREFQGQVPQEVLEAQGIRVKETPIVPDHSDMFEVSRKAR